MPDELIKRFRKNEPGEMQQTVMDLDQIDLGASPYLAMKLYHMTLNQLLTFSVFFGGCIIDIII